MSYSTDELERMAAEIESDLVERKPSASDRSAIRRNICAFANDLAGHGRPGVIFVGVRNDGKLANLSITDKLLRDLAQMRDDGNIMPLPSMQVEKRTLREGDVAVILVEPARQPPVRYQGRVWVKVGPTTRLATAEEEQRLAERRRLHNLPFDMRPAPGATLNDLDLDEVRTEYLPRAIAPDVLESNQRPFEQQLLSLRFIVAEAPTHGALLGFGRDPQRWIPGAFVQFLRLDGAALTDAIRDQKTLTGRLADVLRRIDELLAVNVSIRTDVSGRLETQRPDYPIAALQQVARNAVMHRSYEASNAPTRIYWYADRVEISSPGGLFGQVTSESFGKGPTDYRNPLVAEIMHHLGYAQRFGLGIPMARKALADNGNPPAEFSFEPTWVGVTVRPAP